MIIIPNIQNGIVRQTGEKFNGDIWSSFNLDLETENGIIKVSPRMKLADSTASEANMGLPVAFRHADTLVFMIAGTRVFYGDTADLPNTTYTEDTDTGAKTNYSSSYSDMEVFNANLYTTTTDELMKKTLATNTWTEIDSDFASETTPHPLCFFLKHNRLYYVDSDLVQSINTADVVAASGNYTIDLNISWREIITCMKSSAQSIFIGTIVPSTGSENSDLKGSVYEWDGITSTSITRKYLLESAGVVAMCIKNDIPYIMDANGSLLEYRGNSFIEIGKLPFKLTLPYSNSSVANTRFIHPNGFIPDGDGFLVLVNNQLGDNAGSILENFPSGIWRWSPLRGFIHVMSPSYTTSSTITDYGQNRVSAVGALINMNKYNTSASRNGRYLAGMTVYTNASSTTSGVFYDDSNNTLQKFGYFVTTWIRSSSFDLKDTWEKIAIKYRKLLDSADRIWIKYRKIDLAPTYIDITWTATNTFTTTTNVSALTGYEVEIIQGTGSGKTAHISSVSGSGTYTVVLDDDFTGVTGTAKARVQNWTKILTISDQVSESKEKSFPDVHAERVQIKCCMQFTGEDELHTLAVINSQNTKLK